MDHKGNEVRIEVRMKGEWERDMSREGMGTGSWRGSRHRVELSGVKPGLKLPLQRICNVWNLF